MARYETIANREQVTSLPLVQGTFGRPCGRHVSVDPYWDAADWHEAARGDGGSYSGVVEQVERHYRRKGARVEQVA